MKNLQISFVVLMALFAVALCSVIAEEEKVSDVAPVAVAVEEAVAAEEDTEKQGDDDGRPGRPRRCPADRGNCYQTQYCANRCRGNTDRGECCHNGGLAQYCDDFCKAKNRRNTGRGEGCWCHCVRDRD